VHPVVDAQDILSARQVINDIYIDDKVKDYIVDLVCATRNPDEYKIAVKDFIPTGCLPARHHLADARRQSLRFPERAAGMSPLRM
jgi:MoxR-like ATPase